MQIIAHALVLATLAAVPLAFAWGPVPINCPSEYALTLFIFTITLSLTLLGSCQA